MGPLLRLPVTRLYSPMSFTVADVSIDGRAAPCMHVCRQTKAISAVQALTVCVAFDADTVVCCLWLKAGRIGADDCVPVRLVNPGGAGRSAGGAGLGGLVDYADDE